jgi:hypothetical protein
MANMQPADEEEFAEHIKEVESLGFDNHQDYRLHNGVSIYAANIVDITKDGEPRTTRMSTTASSYGQAFGEMWDTMYQVGIASALNGISSFIGSMIKDLADKGTPAEAMLGATLEMLKDKDFHKMFFDAVKQGQPEMIAIGNPDMVSSMVAQTMNSDEISEELDKFINDVMKGEEEE